MEKEYGKLTADQFRALVDLLPELQGKARDLKRDMQEVPGERWNELLSEGYSWAWVYDFPFIVHLSIVVYAMNLGGWLSEVVVATDPQQRVLDDLRTGPQPSEDFHPDVPGQNGIGLVLSLIHTMQSIALHGRSLSALLQDAHENNDLDSLFRAIKIDRTVVTCPTVADRIAKAELQNDKKFFIKLSNAFKGPSNKEWAGLAKMKLSFHALRELEMNALSDDDLEHLMVHVLDAYKDVPGARKNLRMHYQNFRKFKTI